MVLEGVAISVSIYRGLLDNRQTQILGTQASGCHSLGLKSIDLYGWV